MKKQTEMQLTMDKPKTLAWTAAGICLIWLLAHTGLARAAEDYKGKQESPDVTLSAMGGLGIFDSTGGAAVVGAVAKQIVHNGFIPGINNPVYVELELGPDFTSGSSAIFYSTHLRWDFVKDDDWTLFALGGVGGYVTSQQLGDHWEFTPRFGVGAFRNLTGNLSLRMEASHELIAAGVNFGF